MGDPQLIKRIVNGEFPDENKLTHRDLISEKFFERVDESGVDFEKLLKTSENDVGRVFLFKKYFEWIPYSQDELNLYKKNSITASRLLEKGRKCRSEKNSKEALVYYNLAISYAPHPLKSGGSSGKAKASDEDIHGELFAGLSERSDLLLTVRGGEEARRDITLALDLLKDRTGDIADSTRQEFEERSVKCQKFLDEKQSFMMELAKDSLEEQEKRSKYTNLLLFKIKQPSPVIPCAENFVEIRQDEVKGRQLVVTRDIPPGTTMVVEQPYVKVLKNSLKWDMNHCHYCFRRIRGGGGIPCSGCVFEIYCSTECLQEASKRYHKYECPCYPYFHNTRTQRHIHMAIRIICIVGPQELYRMFKVKDPKIFTPPQNLSNILGTDPDTKIYDSSSYLPIYHLIAHKHDPSDMNDIEYFTNVLQGLVFANVLEKFSPFYDEINYLNTHPKEFFKTFIASLILHHVENVSYNSISLDELTGLEGITLLVKEPTILNERIRGIQFPQYGAATYAVASLINHSCEPNTTRVHDLRNGRMAFVALKGIKAGEELVTSYSRVFLADTRDERRDYLKKTYNFVCNCIACKEDWPPLLQIHDGLQLSCTPCSRKFRTDEKCGPTFSKCALDKKGKCLLCKKTIHIHEAQELLEGKIESFFKAYDLILKNKPLEAIRLIAPCIHHFQDSVVPPYRKLYMAQDLLKSALDLIVYYSESK
ncbi:unnamed protein product [Orchesella dallaii]|uniref:SET and MYND domain-containing protein 4 n=1 Tax=Orchesella dallaii TaxID=48710 RepID=A0ABP1QG53_9HEXA